MLKGKSTVILVFEFCTSEYYVFYIRTLEYSKNTNTIFEFSYLLFEEKKSVSPTTLATPTAIFKLLFIAIQPRGANEPIPTCPLAGRIHYFGA